MAPCHTHTVLDGPVCVITITGTLYHEDVISVSDSIKSVFEAGADILIIDLSQLAYLHSKGLGALLAALKYAQKWNATIAILRPSEKVKELLKITKLDQIFDVYYDNLDYVKKMLLAKHE